MGNSNYTDTEKKELLLLARSSISAKFGATVNDSPTLDNPKFKEKLSCFVTLHSKDGNLRGCIGNIQAYEPLLDNVRHNAVNAAFRDPRFTPISSLGELRNVTIEISVLTKPLQINSPDEFIVGKHGIILDLDGASGVFLPQVAPEQGWDRETTFHHLSLKAGLGPDAWKEKECRFSVFEAIVFSENEYR